MAVSVAVTMVVIVPMVMLGEPCLVDMRVAAVFDGDYDVEPVRLGNLFDGFPVGPVVREQKNLPRSIGAQRLDLDGIGIGTRQTEPGRNTCLVDR
jgi:hypothetical protein